GNSVQVIPAKRDKGIGNDRGLRSGRAVLGVRIGDAAEILEGAHIVLGDAITVGVHPPELPLGDGVTTLGGVLQRSQRCLGCGGRDHFFQGGGGAALGRNDGNGCLRRGRRTVKSQCSARD